ncbi:MAG TPA: FAD-dependent oxidoreductase, partial [Halothiobacillaceae bacterium]|nr:FAD-dependent oxidoreductase [Halothiobacillaceae bacterium]
MTSASQPTELNTDVLIAGGGMVGLSQAWALHCAGWRVCVLEQNSPSDHADKSNYDPRLSALSDGSWRYLQSLGVAGHELANQAAKINEVRVFNQHRFGLTRISAEQAGTDALGQVVPNAALIKRLSSLLDQHVGDWRIDGAQYQSHSSDDFGVVVQVRLADGSSGSITARLLIGADGACSAVREACGIQTQYHDYQQTAVVTTALPKRHHNHIAHECFTNGGPLAVLPAADGRVSVVWVMRKNQAERRMALGNTAFAAELKAALGGRLGGFTDLAPRYAYPLTLVRPREVRAKRTVLIGNAAHSLHPVAGQGFNLCLRDVRDLSRALNADRGQKPDPGADALLANYAAMRQPDYQRIIGLTDALVRGFF